MLMRLALVIPSLCVEFPWWFPCKFAQSCNLAAFLLTDEGYLNSQLTAFHHCRGLEAELWRLWRLTLGRELGKACFCSTLMEFCSVLDRRKDASIPCEPGLLWRLTALNLPSFITWLINAFSNRIKRDRCCKVAQKTSDAETYVVLC